MTQVNIDYIEDKNGNKVAPITHVNAVRDSEGNTLPDILDRDYPTTSKTPVEGSTEVSLVTRGEKYNYDKVNNATDVSGASGIGADFKYLLLNGTTGEFEQALESYVNEKVRSAIGALINNLDKGTGVKAVAGIDSNNDLGTITTANLASVLGVKLMNNNFYRSLDLNTAVEQHTDTGWLRTYYLNLWAQQAGQGTFTNLPSNYSKDQFAYLIVFTVGWRFTTQILIGQKTKIYTRCYDVNTGWSSWYGG